MTFSISAVSHSAMNDMQTIEQDAPAKKTSSSYGSFRKSSMFDRIDEAMQQDRYATMQVYF